MAKAGIQSQIRAKWVVTTDSTHEPPIVDNLLERDFSAEKMARKWVSDIIYVPARRGWLYLMTVMNLADRQVIGWSLSKNMKAENTSMAAFKQVCSKRLPGEQLIFHSDRGIQYAFKAFTDKLADQGGFSIDEPKGQLLGQCTGGKLL